MSKSLTVFHFNLSINVLAEENKYESLQWATAIKRFLSFNAKTGKNKP